MDGKKINYSTSFNQLSELYKKIFNILKRIFSVEFGAISCHGAIQGVSK
ncbi:hypothetical protein PATSB16_18820 [Pandoraea thiooxydans]|nr:hypothetical protein PATSB16_18820 [Pandoraea thiooxydans]